MSEDKIIEVEASLRVCEKCNEDIITEYKYCERCRDKHHV